MSKPKVSVLLSVYNGERYLGEAIESILNQTFTDFEFIIVDDGSTDSSSAILASYRDPRIHLIRNNQNLGLAKSLNKGLQLARGQYIARMDADDISLPERLYKQVRFLDENSSVTMVGTWTEVIDEDSKREEIWQIPIVSHLLRWRLLFKNTFTHCAVMFRRDVVSQLGGYDENLTSAQDYDLWSRISFRWDVANIPEVLVRWRKWGSGISTKKQKEQQEMAKEVSRRNLEYVLGESIDDFTFESFRLLYCPSSGAFDLNKVNLLITNLGRLLNKFTSKFGYSDEIVLEDLKTEITKQMLSLLETNVFEIRQKVIPLLHWLIKFNPAAPRGPLSRTVVKAFLGKRMVNAGRSVLRYIRERKSE